MEKKLYRNEYDKAIAGVCSGLADYMNMDVNTVRILFVLAAIFGVVGVPAYIIIWIIAPVNPDPAARIRHFNQYYNKQDPNMYNSPNAFNNAGFTDPNKWNTPNAPFGTGQSYDPQAFKRNDNTGRTIGGLALLIIGLFFLTRTFHILPYWFSIGKLWPVALVVVGLFFILRSKKERDWQSFQDSVKENEEAIITPPPAATPEDQNKVL